MSKRNQEFDDDQGSISGELKRRKMDRESSQIQLENGVDQKLVGEDHKSSTRSPYPSDKYTLPMTSEPLAHGDYTVGWICALPKEQTAAIAMLDRRHPDLPKPPNDHNAYTLGSIGKHNIVLACLPKGRVGNNSSATIATWMISTFPAIKFGLMVGIGGGIPPKVRLGDVVVSTPTDEFPGVVQWDFGKAAQGGRFKRTGSLNNPPSALLTALTKLETEHEIDGPKIAQYLEDVKKKWPRLAQKYIRSDSLKDVLFDPEYGHISKNIADRGSIADDEGGRSSDGEDVDEEETSCRFCDKTKVVKRKPRDMLVHYGLIASGNQVIKDATLRDTLSKRFGGNVLCVDMEAAGLMNDFPCIVVRGICDYADSHKNKDWQEHAAAVAAAFVKELLSVLPSQEVEQMPTIEDVCNGIKRISEVVNELRSRQHDEKHQTILDWLTPIDYGPQQSDYIGRRQPCTGQWLLDSTEFQVWLKTDKKTLFCPGIPGSGKTIMTAIAIDHLNTRFHNDPSTGIAYLYCNFRQQGTQKAEDLLASLLKQLAQGLSSLPNSVKDLYDRHKVKGTRPHDEFSRTLQSVAAMYSRVFIIVDALDECQVSDGCRSRFLSEIFSLQAKCGINVFATSRFIPEITEEFNGSTLLEIRASDEDVRKYLDGHIFRLPKFVGRNPELQDEIKTEIIRLVDGMFLLTRLHLDSLVGKRSPRAIRAALKKLPTGSEAYDCAYKDAMTRIEGQIEDQKELAKLVLSWITCAKRPLTTSELQHALAVDPGDSELGEDNLPQIEDVRSVCAGLVTVDKESHIIRLVHYTAQEYFERTQKDWFPNAEENITTICVTYLSFSTFETGFCLTDGKFEERLQLNPLYDYAAQNWGYHALLASAEVEQSILDLLQSETKLSACSQVMMTTSSSWYGSSQLVPRQVTGVHLAAYFGLRNIIAALFKNRHDLDLKDTDSRTPLSWAAENGHKAVVKLLVEKGADVESKDGNSCRTPLSWAASNGHEAVVKLLVEKGADVESKGGFFDQTPLSWAASNGHEAVVKLLVEKGADVESKGGDFGGTPLSWAASNGHEAVMKLLVEKGADVESKNAFFDQTPLSWAAENGHEAVVKLLLEKGTGVESKVGEFGRRRRRGWQRMGTRRW